MREPWLSSDPHAWLRPFYATLVERTGFALLAPSLQFDALVDAIAVEHPGKAADLRGWNAAGQRALLGWLADVVAQRPPVRQVEFWRVRKDDRELYCVGVYLPTGIDLRLMEGDGFRRTELLHDARAVKARAEEWRQKLAARGWS